MQLQSESSGSKLVVTVEDERIDAANAMKFKDQMRWIVEDSEQDVLLDMSQVDMIDSSGLGAIVTVMKAMGSDRSLELAGLSEKVRTVFSLTRMDSVMTIHDSVEDGLGGIARAS